MRERARAVTGWDRGALARRYRAARGQTMRLCEPLSAEDMVVQVVEEASPAKWHLAHTTWFFETFVLEAHEAGFEPYDSAFRVLFNSYYNGIGEQHPRGRRGALTRPGIGEVMAYRDTVDERVVRLVGSAGDETLAAIAPMIELGLQHEQQHQELLVTDMKLLLHANPVQPSYHADHREFVATGDPGEMGWVGFDEGVYEVGVDGDEAGVGFVYDNEGPRHRRFLERFEMASRPVTNGEFLAFMEDGGYERHEHWLSDGWSAVQRLGWRGPMYWREEKGGEVGGWTEFTMDGRRSVDVHAPVTHVSFFEADAYARWSGARLVTEAEWEVAARVDEEVGLGLGNFVETGRLHPGGVVNDGVGGIDRLFGDVWEWTRSSHEPYPGYAPPEGAVGEYNGKFMCGMFVLRGGSCATSRGHVRATYRNFFEPATRWQFAGIRLAR